MPGNAQAVAVRLRQAAEQRHGREQSHAYEEQAASAPDIRGTPTEE
jgi:hypothetical protein